VFSFLVQQENAPSHCNTCAPNFSFKGVCKSCLPFAELDPSGFPFGLRVLRSLSQFLQFTSESSSAAYCVLSLTFDFRPSITLHFVPFALGSHHCFLSVRAVNLLTCSHTKHPRTYSRSIQAHFTPLRSITVLSLQERRKSTGCIVWLACALTRLRVCHGFCSTSLLVLTPGSYRTSRLQQFTKTHASHYVFST